MIRLSQAGTKQSQELLHQVLPLTLGEERQQTLYFLFSIYGNYKLPQKLAN